MSQSPSAEEQLWFELVNRARADPLGEFDALIADAATQTAVQANVTSAIRFFDVDMGLLRTQLEGYGAVAPLAWSNALATSADTHSQLMIDFDEQSHQLPGEPGLIDRFRDGGFSDLARAWENVFAYTRDVVHGHAGFYIDWGFGPGGIQNPAGHRNAILSAEATDIGIGMLEVTDPALSIGPFAATQHIARARDADSRLIGVVIDDADGDAFYDIGEGLVGVTVTATRADGSEFVTTSWDSGGYQIALPDGSYTVSFADGALLAPVTYSVTVAGANVKLDAVLAPGETLDDAPTAQDDVLVGSDGDDNIALFAGDDQFAAASGHDTVQGDAGNDTISGDAGTDSLYGGADDDLIEGGTGDDTLRGDGGNDTLFGNSSLDTLYGGDGEDELRGGDGVDLLYGGARGDYLIGHKGWDVLFGEGGDDELRGSSGADSLNGGADHDSLHGGTGVDTLEGRDGNDVLYGNQGADTLLGGQGGDSLFGGSGVDTLLGGAGDDTLYGNEGADHHHGEAGDDELFGGTGDDLLTGGADHDRIFGGQGNDTLEGGTGDDFLRGGTLADVFVYTRGTDRIDDFNLGEDTVRIDDALWTGRLDAEALIAQFGRSLGGNFELKFDCDNRLIFNGGIDSDALADDITIF